MLKGPTWSLPSISSQPGGAGESNPGGEKGKCSREMKQVLERGPLRGVHEACMVTLICDQQDKKNQPCTCLGTVGGGGEVQRLGGRRGINQWLERAGQQGGREPGAQGQTRPGGTCRLSVLCDSIVLT